MNHEIETVSVNKRGAFLLLFSDFILKTYY